MSKYTINDLLKLYPEESCAQPGEVITDVILGEDYHNYKAGEIQKDKFLVTSSNTTSGRHNAFYLSAINLSDYDKGPIHIFVDFVDNDARGLKAPDSYRVCDTSELTDMQKVFSNLAIHGENYKAVGKLTTDINDRIKAGSTVFITFPHGFYNLKCLISICKHSSNGALVYCRELECKKEEFEGIGIHVIDNPQKSLLDSVENIKDTIDDSITIGSKVKAINIESNKTQYVGKVYKNQGTYHYVVDSNSHSNILDIKYGMEDLYVIIMYETDTTITSEEILAEYIPQVELGNIIRIVNDPTKQEGLIVALDKWINGTGGSNVCWRTNNKPYISYMSLTKYKPKDIEILDSQIIPPKDMSSNKYKYIREFSHFLPGYQIKFLADSGQIEANSVGYIVGDNESINNQTFEVVIKKDNSYFSCKHTLEKVSSIPYIEVLRKTNIKDKSVFVSMVDVKKDQEKYRSNKQCLFKYPNISKDCMTYTLQQLSNNSKYSAQFKPNYGEVKLVTRSDAEKLLLPYYVDVFCQKNGINDQSKELLKRKDSAIETFKKIINQDTYFDTIINTNIIKSKVSSGDFIKIIDSAGCSSIVDQGIYRVSSINSGRLHLYKPNETLKIIAVDYSKYLISFEVLNTLSDDEKTSADKIKPLDDTFLSSNSELTQLWLEDMDKFRNGQQSRFKYPDLEEFDATDFLKECGYSCEGGPEEDDVDVPKSEEEFEKLYGEWMYSEFCYLNGLTELKQCSDIYRNKNLSSLVDAFIKEYEKTYGFEDLDIIIEKALFEYEPEEDEDSW